MKKRLPLRERAAAARKAAMPEVIKLCRRYGRSTIAGCIARIRDTERAAKELKAKQRELLDIRKRLKL